MIIVVGMAGAIAWGFIVRVPSLSDAKFRVLADTTASANVHLLGGATPTSDGRPRVVQDEALQWGKTSPVRLQSYDFSGQFGSLEGFSENRN